MRSIGSLPIVAILLVPIVPDSVAKLHRATYDVALVAPGHGWHGITRRVGPAELAGAIEVPLFRLAEPECTEPSQGLREAMENAMPAQIERDEVRPRLPVGVGSSGPSVVQIATVVQILSYWIVFVVKPVLDRVPNLVEYSASVKIQLLERGAVGYDPVNLVAAVEDVMAQGKRAQSREVHRPEIKLRKPPDRQIGVEYQLAQVVLCWFEETIGESVPERMDVGALLSLLIRLSRGLEGNDRYNSFVAILYATSAYVDTDYLFLWKHLYPTSPTSQQTVYVPCISVLNLPMSLGA